MAFNNRAERSGSNGSLAQMQQNESFGWKDLAPKRVPPDKRGRRNILVLLSVAFLVALIFAALRLGAIASGSDDTLQLHIGSQQGATIDLRQFSGMPLSPYLLGANIFPRAGSNSIGEVSSGFMNYTQFMSTNLRDMHVKLLRYPGGKWGEDHVLSFAQLDDFSTMLNQTGSDGMLQAHITGPIKGNPQGMDTIAAAASYAGGIVDYMNNKHSAQRTDPKAPFHPVKFWTVGNEPDLTKNPMTGKNFTVAEYTELFIEYSKKMHQNDQTIKVFGPEISQFYGVGAGPFDAQGHPWMDDFLKGIGNYEKAHPELPYHILDGVSFHRYQFSKANQEPALLMSSTDEWNYLLPSLRTLIKQSVGLDTPKLGQDLPPVAVTEINTNPSQFTSPSSGQAAIWWADTLGTLMNQQVAYVGFFSAEGVANPYPLFTENGTKLTAMGRVMQMFTHLQKNLLPLAIQREPVSVYATEDDARQTLSLMFVNKSYDPQIAQIRPSTQFASFSSWPSQDVQIAGNSVVVLTLHRGQSSTSEAYNFVAPTQLNPQVKPVNYTVCGHSTNPLSPYIPC
ncbi:MAG: hypothetical protein NVS9B9_07700 [Ktedonobacteraceae bacterium]